MSVSSRNSTARTGFISIGLNPAKQEALDNALKVVQDRCTPFTHKELKDLTRKIGIWSAQKIQVLPPIIKISIIRFLTDYRIELY